MSCSLRRIHHLHPASITRMIRVVAKLLLVIAVFMVVSVTVYNFYGLLQLCKLQLLKCGM